MTEHTLTDLIFEALKLHYHETDRRAAEYLAGLVRYAIPAEVRKTIIKECAKAADEVERQQDNDLGSQNSGGASSATHAIRALLPSPLQSSLSPEDGE